MIAAILKAYWKPLAVIVVVLAVVLGARAAWVHHGSVRYDAGYAQAQVDQRQADEKIKAQREQEKLKDEHDAQARIDQARNDALDAASRAGRLQHVHL